jgi:hypothetical protein
LAIEYNKRYKDKDIFITSSDLAFIDNNVTYHSSYSFYFSLFDRVIHYKVIKGSIVTTLLTKAKLLILSITIKDFV